MLAASRAPKAVGRSRICCSANKPTYPFGYGLGCSTFQYSNLHVERVSYAPGEPVIVSFDLENGGTRAADEVAQLYIHQRHINKSMGALWTAFTNTVPVI